MAQRKIDWDKIKTEYVTTDISQRALADKHKVNLRDLCEHSRKEGWVNQRKKHRAKVAEKTERKLANKEATRQANQLSGLLNASYNLRDRIVKATEDPDQFNRYLVTQGRKGGEFETVEVIKDKVDTKAIRELTQSMRALEDLIRSLNNIPTPAEQQRLDIERKKFELEKEKWEREKAEHSAAHEVRITFDTDDMEGWTE